ncbi:hypothetical protein [Haloglomus litoreum]|uniref:hypothetical protein n=1 Tax=Haloglomus litoreum TaxID=3034026 RepID=UPI0023E86F51|nr:hypothetical protein [Haloglomus sp. DT116]
MYSTGGRSPSNGAETEPGTCTVGTVEHYSCGLASLLVTVVFVVLLYSTLVALTAALGILATTWLVLAVFAVWFVTWLVLELVWEWRAGRLAVRE